MTSQTPQVRYTGMGSKSWIGSCLPEDSPPCLPSVPAYIMFHLCHGPRSTNSGHENPVSDPSCPSLSEQTPRVPSVGSPVLVPAQRCEKEENGTKAGSMSSSWTEDNWTPPCGPFCNTARDIAFWQRPATDTILQNTLYSEWNTNKTWITGGPCLRPGVGSIGWTPLSLKEAD